MKELVTYLVFNGTAREAMTFYGKHLGGQLEVSGFPDAQGKPSEDPKSLVMHARLSKGGSSLLMASDAQPGDPPKMGDNVSVSVHCESGEEIERLFAGFSEGGTVKLPLQDMFWGARFGMLVDRFGIHWMFNFEFPK